jgi:PAS domain S-box-containing protein
MVSKVCDQESQIKQLMDILDSIDSYFYSLDANWNFVYASRCVAEDFEFKREDLLGKNFWKTFPRFVGTEVEKNFRETMEKREVRTFEWKMLYVQDQYREFKVFPSTEGITVYGHDVTDRKKIEASLKESAQLYRTLFDITDDGFVIVQPIFDEDGNSDDYYNLQINKAWERQTGLSAAKFEGKRIREAMPNVEPFWPKTYADVIRTGKSSRFENYNQASKRWYDVYAFPYKQGKVGVLFRDITQRKAMEKQLHESERLAAIGATAGMVGHDIRNPLQAMTGDLYLIKEALKEDNGDKKLVHESVDAIEDNIAYINKIVSDLQDYTRPIAINKKDTNVKTVINSVMASIEIPQRIQTVVVVDPEYTIKTDHDYLRRILTNIVLNAVQAMPNGGILRIQATGVEGKNMISIEDNGVGIPDNVKERLFTPLFTTKAKGQGLGLAVVKHLVDGLNGSVSVESEVGKGTKFTIVLPAV